MDEEMRQLLERIATALDRQASAAEALLPIAQEIKADLTGLKAKLDNLRFPFGGGRRLGQ